MYLATINALKKDELISRFCMAISLLESQLDNVSSLELKVNNLSESLEEQDNRDERLESGAIRVKFFFEDTVFNIQRLMAFPCSNPSVPSYASTVRDPPFSRVGSSTAATLNVPNVFTPGMARSRLFTSMIPTRVIPTGLSDQMHTQCNKKLTDLEKKLREETSRQKNFVLSPPNSFPKK
ncbi:hypothetical protein DAPPUDRAFT_322663 [Daphnia pulex]|uniref:Uncharacterized protein n=1 Tax=Daphnia pulex TaxID=6669 RepID=E9GWN4_DAPPU|nr:hypothetical protein DAPPUDRAFT_322663 [Daphnia pulex]|eukprot:EFX76148.1 hypothetical protein DAPPUDRAFT_322663 [Daphnia pulex]